MFLMSEIICSYVVLLQDRDILVPEAACNEPVYPIVCHLTAGIDAKHCGILPRHKKSSYSMSFAGETTVAARCFPRNV
jgi:hypothetical protein